MLVVSHSVGTTIRARCSERLMEKSRTGAPMSGHPGFVERFTSPPEAGHIVFLAA